jgi:hypothetical protein
MQLNDLISALEREWDRTSSGGFFAQLGLDLYDQGAFERTVGIIDGVSFEDDCIDRRLVELLWFMPTYMRWQRDGWTGSEEDAARLDRAIRFIEQRLTTILGLP